MVAVWVPSRGRDQGIRSAGRTIGIAASADAAWHAASTVTRTRGV